MLREQENYGIIDQVKRLCYKVSKTSADTHGHIPERGDRPFGRQSTAIWWAGYWTIVDRWISKIAFVTLKRTKNIVETFHSCCENRNNRSISGRVWQTFGRFKGWIHVSFTCQDVRLLRKKTSANIQQKSVRQSVTEGNNRSLSLFLNWKNKYTKTFLK